MSSGDWVLVALILVPATVLLILSWWNADRDFDAAMNIANDFAERAKTDLDYVMSLNAENERLERAVQAVRDLHKPTPGSLGMGSPYTYCDVEGVSAPWPCLTVEALDAALGDQLSKRKPPVKLEGAWLERETLKNSAKKEQA